MKKKTATFEEAIARLEAIVAKLGEGSLPLEDSLALFEEGAGLVKLCDGQLGEAQLKLETLFPDQLAPAQEEEAHG